MRQEPAGLSLKVEVVAKLCEMSLSLESYLALYRQGELCQCCVDWGCPLEFDKSL